MFLHGDWAKGLFVQLGWEPGTDFGVVGANYTFPDHTLLPPGAIIVLSSDNDPTAFANRYPGVLVFGTFSGSLANEGERLELRDVNGNIVSSVDYDVVEQYADRALGHAPFIATGWAGKRQLRANYRPQRHFPMRWQ